DAGAERDRHPHRPEPGLLDALLRLELDQSHFVAGQPLRVVAQPLDELGNSDIRVDSRGSLLRAHTLSRGKDYSANRCYRCSRREAVYRRTSICPASPAPIARTARPTRRLIGPSNGACSSTTISRPGLMPSS